MTLTVARKILDLLVGFAFVTAAVVTNPVVEDYLIAGLNTIGIPVATPERDAPNGAAGSAIAADTHCGMFDCDATLDTSTIDDLR